MQEKSEGSPFVPVLLVPSLLTQRERERQTAREIGLREKDRQIGRAHV